MLRAWRAPRAAAPLHRFTAAPHIYNSSLQVALSRSRRAISRVGVAGVCVRTLPHGLGRRPFSGATAAARSHISAANEAIVCTEEEKQALLDSDDLQERIRNFSIIAHIDHGKSTLSDRLLEMSGNINALSKAESQCLDRLQVERDRGITVKAQSASMFYKSPTDGKTYLLNLIDTPGHVDFSYEVSRSLAACNGALLLVDSSQGIQAQTLATYYSAMEQDLEIIPVLTKTDLPHADPDGVAEEIEEVFGFEGEADSMLRTSAKTGSGALEVFESLVTTVPAPTGDVDAPLRGLLFDSWFDTHRGVILLIRVEDGMLREGDRIGTYHASNAYDVQEVGLLLPHMRRTGQLKTGQVGYVIAGMKTTKEARLGETIVKVLDADQAHMAKKSSTTQLKKAKADIEPLPGFQPAKSMVFAGLFPADMSEFDLLSDAMDKLLLNDSSVQVQRESSTALGLGFRCGFLGILHMDVFTTRLEQEFGTAVIVTAPTVPYRAIFEDGTDRIVESPAKFPTKNVVGYQEPLITASIIVPNEHMGSIMDLCMKQRGVANDISNVGKDRILCRYTIPLANVVSDFYDKVKAVTSGYASFDYEEAGFGDANLCKLDVLINGEPVDALSVVCEREAAQGLGREIALKLKKNIERQNFEVIIQAAIAKKIIARERIPPYRKDVLTKGGKTVGGGDITRKKKLLEKQKEGKKRMRAVGNVELGQDAFHSIVGRGTQSKSKK